MLRLEQMLLAFSDAMFSGAGAFHRERAFRDAIDERLGSGHFLRVFHHDHDRSMEIAVTDVPDDRRNDAARLGIALCFRDAFGKPGNRYADIGHHDLRSRAIAAQGPEDVVARLPEPRAVFGLGRPFETARAVLARDVAEALRLLGYARLRAMKFEEQRGLFGQAVQLQGQLGDDSERAFSADHESREVIARG